MAEKKDRFIRISDNHQASYSLHPRSMVLTTPVIKRAATNTLLRARVQTRGILERFQEKSIIVNVTCLVIDHASPEFF